MRFVFIHTCDGYKNHFGNGSTSVPSAFLWVSSMKTPVGQINFRNFLSLQSGDIPRSSLLPSPSLVPIIKVMSQHNQRSRLSCNNRKTRRSACKRPFAKRKRAIESIPRGNSETINHLFARITRHKAVQGTQLSKQEESLKFCCYGSKFFYQVDFFLNFPMTIKICTLFKS